MVNTWLNSSQTLKAMNGGIMAESGKTKRLEIGYKYTGYSMISPSLTLTINDDGTTSSGI